MSSIDVLIARDNQTHFLNALSLITAPAVDASVEEVWPRGTKTHKAQLARHDWLYELTAARPNHGPAGKRADFGEDGVEKLWASCRP